MFDPFVIFSGIPQTAYNLACGYGATPVSGGSLNSDNWLQINLLVILAGFMIAAFVYSISNVFPTSMREKLKGAVKYEYFQMTLALVIVLALIAFSSATCQIGQVLTYNSQAKIQYYDPMQYAEGYLNNLLFTKGFSLFTSIFAESQNIVISANVMDTLEEIFVTNFATPLFSINPGLNILGVYYGFSSTLTSTFTGLILVTFGVIFIIYLFLPIVQSLALTVVVPLALIMRSIPFAGPRFREAADSFLAIAIAFYFIFPLCILLNNYLITWLYTPCYGYAQNAVPSLCNPYVEFSGAYKLNNVPIDTFFQTSSQSVTTSSSSIIGVPWSFFAGGISGAGGGGATLSAVLNSLLVLPQVIVNFGQDTAQYIFQGIVLMGLDIAITLGFAQGLSKGFGSASKILGVGPFWGNV